MLTYKTINIFWVGTTVFTKKLNPCFMGFIGCWSSAFVLSREIVTIWNETRSLKEKRKLIVSKFINMLAKIILDICAKHKTFTIVLSGGVFQNKTLLQKVTSKLKEKNQTFYFQQSTPINDGSISLGQIFYAVHRCK